MICWPVSPRVGNVKNNDASLIEPISGIGLAAKRPQAKAREPLPSCIDCNVLVGCAPHHHELHLSQMYGLRRDQARCIFLKNDGLVFYKGK